MYIDHFKLKDYPFRITPDTDYLYMSAAHSRAKAYMEYAVFHREGFVVITGEIGSGKTTLIKKFISEIDEDILVCEIFQTQLDEVELLQAILVQLGVNPFGAKKVELLGMVNQFLVESFRDGKHVLLIIDDAQNLSKRVLEEITMLSGVETQKEKILHVILVGQPELNHKLEATDMEQLLQRVSLRYHVRALSMQETKEYIQHRLSIAGIKRQIFDNEVLPEIYEYTGGVPRLINTFCDTALTCAFADNSNKVARAEMDSTIKELQWKKYTEIHKDKQDLANEMHEDDISGKISRLAENLSSDQGHLEHRVYGAIGSRALVEISKQLKRIADYLEVGK